MKKAMTWLLAVVLVLSMTACGSTPAETQAPTAPSKDPVPVATAPSETIESNIGAKSGFEYSMIEFLAKYDQYRTDEPIRVLYLVCTTYAEYFPNSFAVWEPVLKEHNIAMDLVGPPNYSDESLISTLESSLATGDYDVVLLYPITPQAITPLLSNIWDTYKVPVVAWAFDPSTGCGHYYCGTSYYNAGVTAGNSIIEYVNKNKEYYDTLETIPVAVYKNSAGAEQYQRIVGAMDVLKADGRFTLIDEYEANGEAACLTATETLLNSHPEVEVILTQIDNDVTGAYQAVASGVYPCSDYLSIWGFDATGAVLAQMYADGVDGYVQGSALIDHYMAADVLVEFLPIVAGAAKEGTLIEFTEDEFNYMGTVLGNYYKTVTPENVNDYYKP